MEQEARHVLCIDDEEMIRKIIGDFLENQGYVVTTASDGTEGLELFERKRHDIVLVDLRMPGMDGLEVLEALKERAAEIPVIVISGTGDIRDVIEALRRGAWDYLTKPIENMEVLRLAMEKSLSRAEILMENRKYKENLEDLIHQRTSELENLNRQLGETLREVVNSLAMVTEKRDPYTAGHQERVSIIAVAIAEELGLPPDQVEGIRIAGMLHDVGKISIPQELLSKPTRLTGYEMEIVKTHSAAGYEILKNISFPWRIDDFVHQHHERLDGSGYPNGLSGDDILYESRILAIADVVEAMSSHRPYRPARGIESALTEIREHRGIYFDPEAVDVCIALFETRDARIMVI